MKSTAPRASVGFFNNLQIFTSVNLFVFQIVERRVGGGGGQIVAGRGYQVSHTYCQVSLLL